MKLLEQMQQKIKMKGLSPKTFETYAQHCEDFFRFLLKRFGAWKHPKDVGRPEIEAWLTHKANVEHCSKSSQNTALQSVYVHADQHQATSAKSPLEALLANPQLVTEHRKSEEKPTLRIFAG